MTGREALEILKKDLGKHYLTETAKNICYDEIERDLEVLEILKPRIKLKDSKVKNDSIALEVGFVEASGFVIKNSREYDLLKDWLESGIKVDFSDLIEESVQELLKTKKREEITADDIGKVACDKFDEAFRIAARAEMEMLETNEDLK